MKDNELTDPTSDPEATEALIETLNARLDRLEREGQEVRLHTEQRIILSELKGEAIRAGMVDLDGMTFLDITKVHLDDNGNLAGGVELINQMKRSKPWLFSAPSSSSIAKVPPSRPTRQKMATEMTDDEYKRARADIIRRSSY